MTSISERRHYPRYRIGEGAIAVLASSTGHIQDISLSGLSFVSLQQDNEPQPHVTTVDILDGQNDFFMEAIPCRLVSEKLIVNDSSFSTVRMVQRSLEFGPLTKSRRDELETYIVRHARHRG